MFQKTALRKPTVTDGQPFILRPIPVYPPVKLIRELANFAVSRQILVKILCRDQHPGDQNSRINCGEFGCPRALSADRIKKMVVKALIARSVWLRSLMAVCEKAHCDYASLHSLLTRDPGMFDTDWKYCQPKANSGDTGGRIFPGAIEN